MTDKQIYHENKMPEYCNFTTLIRKKNDVSKANNIICYFTHVKFPSRKLVKNIN